MWAPIVPLAEGEEVAGETLPPLFVLKPSANKLWFNTRLVDTPRLKEAYAYAGWLVAQQLSNCASVNIPLPELVFEKLLEGDRFKVLMPLPACKPEGRHGRGPHC